MGALTSWTWARKGVTQAACAVAGPPTWRRGETDLRSRAVWS